jgi:hypothetical protein
MGMPYTRSSAGALPQVESVQLHNIRDSKVLWKAFQGPHGKVRNRKVATFSILNTERGFPKASSELERPLITS